MASGVAKRLADPSLTLNQLSCCRCTALIGRNSISRLDCRPGPHARFRVSRTPSPKGYWGNSRWTTAACLMRLPYFSGTADNSHILADEFAIALPWGTDRRLVLYQSSVV